MATAEELIKSAQERMVKSVEHARTEFSTVRTGRASSSLLDRIEVDYYGTQTPLRQLSTINVPEPRMLTVQPFDPSSIKAIEKAVMESDLGLTPSNDGKLIRLPIPQLTEERRKELAKVVRGMAEEGKVALRRFGSDRQEILTLDEAITVLKAEATPPDLRPVGRSKSRRSGCQDRLRRDPRRKARFDR